MTFKNTRTTLICVLLALVSTSCAPKANAAPTIDVVGTMAVELASVMQTQTAMAIPTDTLIPTASATPSFTETPTLSPPTEEVKRQPSAVITFVPCYTGPDETYKFISNIDPSIRRSGKQVVEILGAGSEPGWVVIRNPYFNNPCWVKQENMEIGPHIILSDYPVMTPGP